MSARTILIVVAAALLAGCGSKTDEVDTLRAEQAKALDEVRQQVETLTTQLGRIRREIGQLDEDLFELRGQLEFALVSPRGSSTPATGTGADAGGPELVPEATASAAIGLETVEPIEADLEIVAAELTKVRDTLEALRTEYSADKELAELQDPRRTWEALSDPEELFRRLDRFAVAQADEFEDEAVREQFLTDVEAYKQQLVARATMTKEEQIAQHRARLSEQISSDSSGRRRQWYQSQLDALDAGDEEAVDEVLDRTQRFENARELGDLAEKYEISRETMRDNGLAAFGGRGPGGGPAGGGRGRTRDR